MHIADPKLGIFGANGIVAAGLPIAVGAAAAAQLRGGDGVAVAFFGDGAAAQGAFHEALNLAAVWRLPVIFFCENNGYSEFSPDGVPARGVARAPGRRLRAPVRRRWTATTSSPRRRRMSDGRQAARDGRRSHRRRGGHLPLARSLRGRPAALPHRPRSWTSGASATRWSLHRRRLVEAGVERGRDRAARVVGGGRARRGRRSGALVCPSPAAATLFDFVVRERPPAAEPRAAAGGRGDVAHHGRHPQCPRVRAGRRRAGLPRRGRRRRGRQRVRADPWAARTLRRAGPRHADLRDGDRRSGRRCGHGRHAPRRRGRCTSTSSACASTSC